MTTVTPALGGAAQPGAAVLTATSPDPVVDAALPVAQEYLVAEGNQVSVTLPDGTTTVGGVVASVSRVATTGSGGSSDGSSPGASGGSSGGGGANGSGSGPTVQLTVRLSRPGAAGNLDQAPAAMWAWRGMTCGMTVRKNSPTLGLSTLLSSPVRNPGSGPRSGRSWPGPG